MGAILAQSLPNGANDFVTYSRSKEDDIRYSDVKATVNDVL